MRLIRAPPLVVDQPHLPAERRQATIGVVVTQQQPIFGPTGKHPVRLIDPAGDQVIDQHPQVRLAAIEHEGGRAAQRQRGVDSRPQPLPRRLLVAGRPVQLPREVQPLDPLGFERGLQLRRGGVVVFNGVPVPHHLGPLQSADAMDHPLLDIPGETGRDPVAVILERVPPLGLEEDLVRQLVGEPDYLVFYRGAIAWSCRGNLTAVHRGAVQVLPNQRVRFRIGFGEVAIDLRLRQGGGEEREGLGIGISRLQLDPREINGATIEAGGGPGLEAGQFKTQLRESPRDSGSGPLAGPASRLLGFARVHHRLQKGARGEDDSPGLVTGVPPHQHSPDLPLLGPEPLDHFLAERQVGLLFDHMLHEELVGLFVGLGPGAVHRRTLGPVEQAKLDPRGINRPAHFSPESVDFPDDLPLGDPSDRGIAAHGGDHVAAHGQEGGAGSQARRGEGGLDAGVPGPNHHHIKGINKSRHEPGHLKRTGGIPILCRPSAFWLQHLRKGIPSWPTFARAQ